MAGIKLIKADVIHDSRGDETIQVTVETDSGEIGSAAVPAGKSVGSFEAKTVDPQTAVNNVNQEILPELQGRDVSDQAGADMAMIKLDGTADKHRLGANAILGVSMAISRAASSAMKLPLYRYIGQLDSRTGFSIPIPMFNVINGGRHAENNLDIQEFMVIPDKVTDYHNQLSAGKLIFSTLGQLLKGDEVFLPTGDEGGYAPDLDTNEMAMEYLVRAIRESGYEPWDEVSIGLDVAATNLPPTFEISSERYLSMLKEFPLLTIEDPFAEEDWPGWCDFRSKLEKWNTTNKKILLIGDDLFVTNPVRLQKGIESSAANAILIKLNQIGTLTETMQVVDQARQAGYVTIVSHRSGETLDDYIADLSVGIGSQFIKTGAPNDSHPERMAKYRRLLQIEKELAGPNA